MRLIVLGSILGALLGMTALSGIGALLVEALGKFTGPGDSEVAKQCWRSFWVGATLFVAVLVASRTLLHWW